MYELTELFETENETFGFQDEKAAYKVAMLISKHGGYEDVWDNPNDHLGSVWGIPYLNLDEAPV